MPNQNIYDLIIIGAGPGGITAAIYAARRKINFLIIGMDIGGQMSWSSEVDNYPGMPDLTGIQITTKFFKHMKDYNIKVKKEEVIDLNKKGNICVVKTKKAIYQSKAVIIISGKKPKKLNVLGEDELSGKGVTYCATCDAPLYKNKTVAVIGAGNSGLESALFLSKYAKKVYIMDILKKLAGEPYLREKVLAEKKITFIPEAKTKKILGKNNVEAIVYESIRKGKESEKGKEITLKVDGVFIEIGLIAKVDFAKTIKKNQWGEIMIFRSTKTHEENLTSVPGVFAAGDVTDIPAKQIVVAAGEGCKAALAAFDYIARWDKKYKGK